MKSICVFCGSGSGNNPQYQDAASALGRAIAAQGMTLVYGGSNIGLMGRVSSAARDGGASVVGIIPRRIADHVALQSDIETEVVDGMHERKARMYALSDAIVALPGGIGTMDEFFEAWVWNKLGYHTKPLALLNIGGFYDRLLSFLEGMTSDGFLQRPQYQSLIVEDSPEPLLRSLERWQPPEDLDWDQIG